VSNENLELVRQHYADWNKGVLVLRVASELAPPEIANRLGREVSEVQEILAAAFEKLRQLPVREAT
jgi:DNA-directed RNA polymerase specialized sigma24 family protein